MQHSLICESSDPALEKIRAMYSGTPTPEPTIEEDAAEWGITPEDLRKKLGDEATTHD